MPEHLLQVGSYLLKIIFALLLENTTKIKYHFIVLPLQLLELVVRSKEDNDIGLVISLLVIRELDTGGYIFRRKKNSIKNRLRFNGTLVNCYEIILPEDNSESDEDCMTLEYILTHFEGLDES